MCIASGVWLAGMDFSVGGKYLALAERRDCKDFISVFECASWRLVKVRVIGQQSSSFPFRKFSWSERGLQCFFLQHFETETEDLAGVQWSPDGRVLCVWESPLQVSVRICSFDFCQEWCRCQLNGLFFRVGYESAWTFLLGPLFSQRLLCVPAAMDCCVFQYKVLLYSVDGRCLASYSAYEYALGVKSVAWSPTSQFLAIGSYDQKVKCVVFVSHWNSKPEAGVGQVEVRPLNAR